MMRQSMHAMGGLLIVLLAVVGWQEWTPCSGRSPDDTTPGRQPSDRNGSVSQTLDRTTDADPKSDMDDEPLLLLDDEPPLLLDDDDDVAPLTEGGPVADNSRCHVCHLDYAVEEIAVVHAKANLGCISCHGDCDEHIADESWASGGNGTPPGKMYRLVDINAYCETCHKEHNAPARTVVARWQEHCFKERHAKTSEKTDPKKIVCTDCHGEHRLKERKCHWK